MKDDEKVRQVTEAVWRNPDRRKRVVEWVEENPNERRKILYEYLFSQPWFKAPEGIRLTPAGGEKCGNHYKYGCILTGYPYEFLGPGGEAVIRYLCSDCVSGRGKKYPP